MTKQLLIRLLGGYSRSVRRAGSNDQRTCRFRCLNEYSGTVTTTVKQSATHFITRSNLSCYRDESTNAISAQRSAWKQPGITRHCDARAVFPVPLKGPINLSRTILLQLYLIFYFAQFPSISGARGAWGHASTYGVDSVLTSSSGL